MSPILKHTKACKQCPYRRTSWAGWLGSGTPESFAHGAVADHLDEEFPCHVAINYEDKDWKTTQFPTAPLCAGALAMCKNNCKDPRDPVRSALVEAVPADPEVFRSVAEFLAHHTSEIAVASAGFVAAMQSKSYEPWSMEPDELDALMCTCGCSASNHFDYTDECDDCSDCEKFVGVDDDLDD